MNRQIIPVPWFADAANTRYAPVDATNVISQVESNESRQNALACYPLLAPTVKKAVITDFNGYKDPQGNWLSDLATPFVEQGVTCITESYIPDGPTHNPDEMDWSAVNKLGFKKVQPAFGIYEGRPQSPYPGRVFTMQDYAQWFNLPSYWVWLAESAGVL